MIPEADEVGAIRRRALRPRSLGCGCLRVSDWLDFGVLHIIGFRSLSLVVISLPSTNPSCWEWKDWPQDNV